MPCPHLQHCCCCASSSQRQLWISRRCVMTSITVEARVFTCPPAKFSSPHLLLDPCHDSNLTAFPLFAPAPTSPSHFDRATTNLAFTNPQGNGKAAFRSMQQLPQPRKTSCRHLILASRILKIQSASHHIQPGGLLGQSEMTRRSAYPR